MFHTLVAYTLVHLLIWLEIIRTYWLIEVIAFAYDSFLYITISFIWISSIKVQFSIFLTRLALRSCIYWSNERWVTIWDWHGPSRCSRPYLLSLNLAYIYFNFFLLWCEKSTYRTRVYPFPKSCSYASMGFGWEWLRVLFHIIYPYCVQQCELNKIYCLPKYTSGQTHFST